MLMAVPPLMLLLAKHPLVSKYDLSSLLVIFCGAAPLSKEIEDEVYKRIGVLAIRQGFGMSEMTLSVLSQDPEHVIFSKFNEPTLMTHHNYHFSVRREAWDAYDQECMVK